MKCSQEYYFTSNWQSVLIYQRLPAKPEHCIPHLFTSTCCYSHLECEDPSPGRWLGSWENSAHDGWREQETTWHKYNIWIGVEWLLGIICHAWVGWKNGCFYTQNWVRWIWSIFCSCINDVPISLFASRHLDYWSLKSVSVFFSSFFEPDSKRKGFKIGEIGQMCNGSINNLNFISVKSDTTWKALFFFLSRLLNPDFLFWFL